MPSCYCLLLVLATIGCGGEEWGTLSGVVRVDGQPVGPGAILLKPVDPKLAGAQSAFGEDGAYSIVSAGQKEGAAAGEYLVSIRGGEDFGEEVRGPRPPSKIPTKYNDLTTSGLTITIEPGSKTHDFDLKP